MKIYLQRSLLLALVALGFSTGCAGLRSGSEQDRITTQEISPSASPLQTTTTPAVAAAPEDLNYVAKVVQTVGDAVVRIDSSRNVQLSPGGRGLEWFFGDREPQQERVERGTGSGFILTQDGYIITNAHVVAEADDVTVVFKDGRQLTGDVVGTDELTDVAVVKVEATNLPTVPLGDSDKLMPGEFAIAIGNPLGLNNTVTQGIISATERSGADVGVSDIRVGFIQTDAAINPGNSGGPLLNSQGQVVGVNTAIIQGAQGLGFAIPIRTAKSVADQLISKGQVEHPYLGVQMAELTPELQQEVNQSDVGFQVSSTEGILVIEVLENSPAARAGLRPGDVIDQVGGETVRTATQLQQQIEGAGVGSTIELAIKRGDQTETVSVTLEALPVEQLGG